MRWTKQIADGMQTIYSLASVELDSGVWSQIECTARDADGESISPCGKCEQCRAADAMGAALSYLGQIIQRHKIKGE
jgi:hypothetical protein